jgi:putative ABC transport system permease protein
MRLVPETYTSTAKTLGLAGAELDRLRALPGVESASFTNVVPLNDTNNDIGPVSSDIRPGPVRTLYYKYGVSSDYFKTMAIPLLAGRDFQDTDRVGSPRVILINETLARRVFGAVRRSGTRSGSADSDHGGRGGERQILTSARSWSAICEAYRSAARIARICISIRTRVAPASMNLKLPRHSSSSSRMPPSR